MRTQNNPYNPFQEYKNEIIRLQSGIKERDTEITKATEMRETLEAALDTLHKTLRKIKENVSEKQTQTDSVFADARELMKKIRLLTDEKIAYENVVAVKNAKIALLEAENKKLKSQRDGANLALGRSQHKINQHEETISALKKQVDLLKKENQKKVQMEKTLQKITERLKSATPKKTTSEVQTDLIPDVESYEQLLRKEILLEEEATIGKLFSIIIFSQVEDFLRKGIEKEEERARSLWEKETDALTERQPDDFSAKYGLFLCELATIQKLCGEMQEGESIERADVESKEKIEFDKTHYQFKKSIVLFNVENSMRMIKEKEEVEAKFLLYYEGFIQKTIGKLNTFVQRASFKKYFDELAPSAQDMDVINFQKNDLEMLKLTYVASSADDSLKPFFLTKALEDYLHLLFATRKDKEIEDDLIQIKNTLKENFSAPQSFFDCLVDLKIFYFIVVIFFGVVSDTMLCKMKKESTLQNKVDFLNKNSEVLAAKRVVRETVLLYVAIAGYHDGVVQLPESISVKNIEELITISRGFKAMCPDSKFEFSADAVIKLLLDMKKEVQRISELSCQSVASFR